VNQKDYKEIAGIIKDFGLFAHYNAQMSFVNKLADHFEKRMKHKDNPIFNRQQFLKDCGVEK